MLRNYLVTALRSFARHRLYGFINIVGLAVGLACAIFILLFIRDELSYDKWIVGSENLYRVEVTFRFPGESVFPSGGAPFPLTQAMRAQLPEVQAQTHLVREGMTVGVGDRLFFEKTDVVDPDFFSVIRLPFLEGDPASALSRPESVVLSQTMARKYFGAADPLGKQMTVNAMHPLTVTGVIRDLPHNTHLLADIVLPNTSKADTVMPGDKADWLEMWGNAYVRLAPGTDPNAVLARLRPILDKSVDVKKDLLVDRRGSEIIEPRLTRFRDVHLMSGPFDSATPSSSWDVVYGLEAIALLIVLVACVNFTNLATARAMVRAREVGLRKVAGARRAQLIAQFLAESVLMALFAVALALAAVEILLPAFDGFIGRPIQFYYLAEWPLTLGVLLIAVLVGLVSGIYPAFVLSAFRPATALKGDMTHFGGAGTTRTALVVLQFAISIGLGVAAIVIFAQIDYGRRLDLGFDHNNIVVLYGVDPLMGGAQPLSAATRDSLVHALASNRDIAAVAQSDADAVPFAGLGEASPASVPGNPQRFMISPIDISPELPTAYRMRLLTGRLLSSARGGDMHRANFLHESGNILVNEEAVRLFGFTPAGAIGRTIVVAGTPVTIVGVLQNALFQVSQSAPRAAVYYFNPRLLDVFSIRVRRGRVPEALAYIDRTWREFVPTVAIRRHFLDDSFDKIFVSVEQEARLFGFFVGIAIFIASLGLFGLAAFAAERRTREIGIRKAFGARTRDIVRLLLWQFSIPVVIANVVAWPVAYYYLHTWLEGYAYRISLSPLYFIAAGAAALAIAWATVLAHALRVAHANPVHALRYE